METPSMKTALMLVTCLFLGYVGNDAVEAVTPGTPLVQKSLPSIGDEAVQAAIAALVACEKPAMNPIEQQQRELDCILFAKEALKMLLQNTLDVDLSTD